MSVAASTGSGAASGQEPASPQTTPPNTPSGGPTSQPLLAPTEMTPNRGQTVTEETACAATRAEAKRREAVLLLLVDTSGSMSDPVDEHANRIGYTVEAVASAIGALPDGLHVGLVNFPGRDASVPICEVGDVAVELSRLGAQGSEHRQQLDEGIRFLRVAGGTPTFGALRRAMGTLLDFEPETLADAKRHVALITDGTPNRSIRDECGIDYPDGFPRDAVTAGAVVNLTTEMFEQGVSTFVLGSPGSEEGRPLLSQVARAGGTAKAACSHNGPNYCHQDMTQGDDFGQALAGALGEVTRQVLVCSYPVPREAPDGAEVDYERVNVEFETAAGEKETLLQNTAFACEEGWFYAGDEIQLCSNSCARVKESGAATLTLLFGCETRVSQVK